MAGFHPITSGRFNPIPDTDGVPEKQEEQPKAHGRRGDQHREASLLIEGKPTEPLGE
jgi:hypothetical protein